MATTTQTKKLSVAECDRMVCRPGTMFEIEEIEINGLKQRSWKNQIPNYRALLMSKFELYKDREFINAPKQHGAHDERESITFGEAFKQALALAAWLRQRGIGVESRVAIIGYNSIGWVVSWVAIHLLGAVPVMVNCALQTDALLHCLKVTQPKIILADAPATNMLAENAGALDKMGCNEYYCWQDVSKEKNGSKIKTLTYADLGVPQAEIDAVFRGDGIVDKITPDSDASIFFTSGTTGYPKAALASQRANMHNFTSGYLPIIRSALRQGLPLQPVVMLATAPNEEQNVGLLAIPFFHGTGCVSWLAKAIHDGTKLVTMRRWSVKDGVKLMIDHNVNTIGGVPAVATAIIQSGLLPKDHKLRAAAYGGAAPQARLAADVKERWPDAIPSHGWGMTELTVLHCAAIGQDYVDKPKSCGPPVPICDIKIVGEDRKELPAGTVGKILARGPNVMKCYVGNEKATRETIDAEGWLDTGDAGYVDDEGFLYIADRIKDIIIRGGENIASEEVENAIYQDSRVAEAASVPVPHDVLGELVGLAVSLAPGATATPDDIIEKATARLRRDARPVFVWISDDPLARNINGKLVKADIKKIVQEKYKQHLARQSKL